MVERDHSPDHYKESVDFYSGKITVARNLRAVLKDGKYQSGKAVLEDRRH